MTRGPRRLVEFVEVSITAHLEFLARLSPSAAVDTRNSRKLRERTTHASSIPVV